VAQEKLRDLSSGILREHDSRLSQYAVKHADAVRSRPQDDVDFRSPFARDRDRILYSGGFRRYVGKTQVVYFASQFDEHITNRAVHSMQVSQIGRTVGRLLRLNVDLIEAVALGHDLGHPPFGHDGEEFLDELCHRFGIGHFNHNVHSLYYVDTIANGNRGMNLTFQVRDGIIFHDGEAKIGTLRPRRGRTEQDIQDYIASCAAGHKHEAAPSTLEGCVVRMSDTAAYVGQDIEDAIRMGIIQRGDIPLDLVHALGDSNSRIIDSLVSDMVAASVDSDSIGLSRPVLESFSRLRDFNYKRIYSHPEIRKEKQRIENAFRVMFEYFLNELEHKRTGSIIYPHFLENRSEQYLEETPAAVKVRDYIATMTDRYFTKVFEDLFLPRMPG
jgi:dGTPase